MAAEQRPQIAVPAASKPMTRDEVILMFARRQVAFDDLDAAALAADYADEATIDSPLSGSHGKADAARRLRAVFDAFLDLKMTFEPPIIDGDRVAQFGIAEGTNIGGLMGLSPSGRSFKMSTAFFYHLKGGRIVREHRVYDFTGLLVQVGVLKGEAGLTTRAHLGSLSSVVFASLFVVSAMPLAAQLPPNNDVVQKTSPAGFMLMSTDLKGNMFAMPQILNGFGCTGGNVSPELSWHGAPQGTRSFVLTMFDPDAPTGSGFWHWVVANIPASAAGLPTGASRTTRMPAGSLETRNDTGAVGYAGPCPPPGPAHRYVFTLFAMRVDRIDVTADASGALVGFNTRANVLGATTLATTHRR